MSDDRGWGGWPPAEPGRGRRRYGGGDGGGEPADGRPPAQRRPPAQQPRQQRGYGGGNAGHGGDQARSEQRSRDGGPRAAPRAQPTGQRGYGQNRDGQGRVPPPPSYGASGGRRGYGAPASRYARSATVGSRIGTESAPRGGVASLSPWDDEEVASPSGGRRPGGGGSGPGRRGGRSSSRTARLSRRRRILKWTGLGTAVVMVAAGSFAGYWWYRLNHNIHVSSLHGSLGVTGVVPEQANKFGDKPLNILIIGSDGRNNAADCKIGGDCQIGAQGSNGDVEMLVHVSADRSSASVVSIPRDTETKIPACKQSNGTVQPATFGMINSALQVSPGCQVDTVEQLTHVDINHFIEVDFMGVVEITNAVGGVPVCVTAPVHDPYSGLNLPAGTSTVKGMQALAFVRSRHGFGDGSDLYRTQVQHMYLSSLIRKLKSQGTLSNAGNLLHIADVATKALTVDPGLDGVQSLMSLAQTLKGVPTDHISFMTMPTETYLPNPAHVQPEQPQDNQLFSILAHDTGNAGKKKPAPSAPASTPAAAAPSSVGSVLVANGTDSVGRAGEVAQYLGSGGFGNVQGVNYTSDLVNQTKVYYAPGDQADGEAVAQRLHIPSAQVVQGATSGASVELVIGSDFTSGQTYSASGANNSGAVPSALASSANAQNAANNECAKANSGG